MADFEVFHVAGHYEVYVNGDFICSADTYSEAVEEVEKTLKIATI